jgi:DNA primase
MQNNILATLVEEDFGIDGRGKWLHSETHDSLVVNAEKGTFFWNSTGIRGDAFTYLTQVRGYTKEQASKFLKNFLGGFSNSASDVNQAVRYEKLIDLFWSGGKNHREYWYKRLLKDSTIDRYRLGYYDGWFLVPIYVEGEFVNFQCRRDTPTKKITQWYKHSNSAFLFNSGILPFTNTIYITEGLVDSILLTQEGLPSVAASGANSWQDSWYSKFSKIDNIFYFEDNDSAGRQGAKMVANSLGVGRVKIVSFSQEQAKYDVGDFFQNGGTASSLLEYIKTNSKYIFELESPTIKRKELKWKRK